MFLKIKIIVANICWYCYGCCEE